jgi:hypothetical protein
LGGLGFLLHRRVLNWLSDCSNYYKLWLDSSKFDKVIIGLILLIFIGTLINALTPPTKFDALVYHLALPRHYINMGGFVYTSENMFWGMPQLVESLYTWTMALGGINTASVIGWATGLVAIAGLTIYISKRLGLTAAWVGSAAILSGYSTAASLAWGYVDWTALLFGTCFFITMDLWRRKRGDGLLYLAATFVGFAFGTKYSAGIFIPIGFFIILIKLYPYVKAVVWKNIVFLCIVLLTASPWLIKNLLATGNPIYPFLFPSGAMTPVRLDLYQVQSKWAGLVDIFFLPFRATIQGVEGGSGYGASIGPLLLIFGFLFWFGWSSRSKNERGTISTAYIVSGVGILIWIIAGQTASLLIQSRLYYSLFPALSVLAAAGFLSTQEIKFKRIRCDRLCSSIIIIVLGLNMIQIWINVVGQGSLTLLLGLQSNESFLTENLGWYQVAMQSINDLPSDKRILMLWEPRSLYCLPDCVPDEVLDRWLVDLYRYGNIDLILQSWREQGYTHVLLYRAGVNFLKNEQSIGGDEARYRPEDWLALENLLDKLTPVDNFGQAYELYNLAP